MNDSSLTKSRAAGVLLHVTSLPGPHGIGEIGGRAARAWVDRLAKAKQRWWQVLPLTPPGAGDSPYQSFSAFAGNADLISPEGLIEMGLLARADVPTTTFPAGRVDFARAHRFKRALLSRAWATFRGEGGKRLRDDFDRFRHANRAWLDDFAIFTALKRALDGAPWHTWPRDVAARRSSAIDHIRHNLADEIAEVSFAQFLFFRQLDDLRAYAAKQNVGLIGDLPIFVSPESADVWANPKLFKLDRHFQPTVVAGVPPDYFSKTGQRWGNPLYHWPAMRRDKFGWWVERLRGTLRQVDLVRIDHFRGFDACWEIPANNPTAEKGRWAKAPGRELFETVQKELRGLPFIAEDLGVITPAVERLRDDFRLPGMRVVQFAFGGGPDNPFLPHNYVRNSVAYTGTHDNDTTAGWFRTLSKKDRRQVETYAPGAFRHPAAALMRLAWASISNLAIAPAQDLLGLGSAARMNVPGRPTGNWRWRLDVPDAALSRAFDCLGELTQTYGRAAAAK